MDKRIKIIKIFFLIFGIPAMFGLYFSVKYYGWQILGTGAILASLLPGFFWGITVMEPQQNATRYTYIKDKRKFLGQGKLISIDAMHDNKTLKEAEKEHTASIKNNLGGDKQAFINLFLIPYIFCATILFTLLGWITFFEKL